MRTKVSLWRWRRSPLRRRSDVAEAWVVLTTGLAIAVAAPVAGAVTAGGVQDALAEQRQARHSTAAVLTANAPAMAAYKGDGRVRAAARWTGRDGSVRSGNAKVTPGLRAGARVMVWTDDGGALTGEPPGPAEAEAQAGLAGASAAAGVGILLLAGSRIVRWRLDQSRAMEWERAWAQVGPQWTGRRS